MLSSSRCPLCTLTLPCKHFESKAQLYLHRGKLFRKQEWALLTQENRNALIKIKRKLQLSVKEERQRSTPLQSMGGISRNVSRMDVDQASTM